MAAVRAFIDCCRWMRLDRGMPVQNVAAILGEILSEADALIRLRLKEQGLELPHLVVAVTPDNKIVLRSNVSDDVIRTRIWLQSDRQLHWKNQTRQRTRELAQAEQELLTARLSGMPEAVKSRQMTVNKARLALREAEERLARVKQWMRQFETQVESRAKVVTQLRHSLAHDMRKAVAFLEGAAATLAAYADMAPPAPLTSQLRADEPDTAAPQRSSAGAQVPGGDAP